MEKLPAERHTHPIYSSDREYGEQSQRKASNPPVGGDGIRTARGSWEKRGRISIAIILASSGSIPLMTCVVTHGSPRFQVEEVGGWGSKSFSPYADGKSKIYTNCLGLAGFPTLPLPGTGSLH